MRDVAVHQLSGDIAGEKYRRALQILIGANEYFSLTLRPDLRFLIEESAILRALEPLFVKEEKRLRWPGTEVFTARIPVRYYRTSKEALETLLIPGSLHSWRAPAYPEDLAFYAERYDCSFACTAHEEEAWVLSSKLACQIGGTITLERVDVSPENLKLLKGVA